MPRLDSSVDPARMINTIESTITTVLLRPVAIDPDAGSGYARFAILQRCAACRGEIRKVISNGARTGEPVDAETTRLLAEVGAAARHAYVRHRCPPVESDPQLAGMSRAELEQLEQDLERDGAEMVKRAVEVGKLARERSPGGEVDRHG